MTTSVRESGIPLTVSRKSPSRNVRPSTSRPSPTKNAVIASRSSTVIPTWSKVRRGAMAAILQRLDQGVSAATRKPTFPAVLSGVLALRESVR